MRVISGDMRGRPLRTPPGKLLRPTQGHVRQVLFDIVGDAVSGTRVLDLFAGAGALGIEALSRGASEAVFIERDATVLRYLRENVETLELGNRCRILAVSVTVGLRILEEQEGAFRWVFADPPYSQKIEPWLLAIGRPGPGGVLSEGGTLVLETSRRNAVEPSVGGLHRYRTHQVGETNLEFFGWEGT